MMLACASSRKPGATTTSQTFQLNSRPNDDSRQSLYGYVMVHWASTRRWHMCWPGRIGRQWRTEPTVIRVVLTCVSIWAKKQCQKCDELDEGGRLLSCDFCQVHHWKAGPMSTIQLSRSKPMRDFGIDCRHAFLWLGLCLRHWTKLYTVK